MPEIMSTVGQKRCFAPRVGTLIDNMGRCYEFGVSIASGCEHAMVVADHGGHCHCPECGETCTGRFGGCSAILSQPGYVPILAPPRRGAARVRPTAAVYDSTPGEPPPKATGPAHMAAHEDPELSELRTMLRAVLERTDGVAEMLQALDGSIAHRDAELVAAFERLASAYTALRNEVRACHVAPAEVPEAIEQGTGLRPVLESPPPPPTVLRPTRAQYVERADEDPLPSRERPGG